jgi:hypothetical protein
MEKKYEQLRDCHSAEAQVCGTVTDRAESALTASSRRNIEYFAEHMKLQVSLGTITVQLVSGYCPQPRNLQQGAATQVFVLDRDNTVRVVHEHFSVPHKR